MDPVVVVKMAVVEIRNLIQNWLNYELLLISIKRWEVDRFETTTICRHRQPQDISIVS